MIKPRWAIIEGECVSIMAAMPEKSVACIITDPPYSEHVHGKSRAGARKVPLRDGNGKVSRCAIDREVDFGFASLPLHVMEAAAVQFARLASRWSMAFCDIESSHLWRESMEEAGLDYCRTGAWIKIGATPQFTGDRPGVGFEAIVIGHQPGRKKWNGGGSLGVWSHLTAIDRGSPSGTAERVHPTQKPLSLMIELVELFTDPGDVVLDPFAGSGTTGVACLRLGRRFIGIEQDPKHIASASERLSAETDGNSLRAHRAKQETMFK